MLTVSPRERISIERVLAHLWFIPRTQYAIHGKIDNRSSKRLSISLGLPPPEFTAPAAPLSSGRRRTSVCCSNPVQQMAEEENKKPSTFEKLKKLLCKKRSGSSSPTGDDATARKKVEL